MSFYTFKVADRVNYTKYLTKLMYIPYLHP